MKRKYFIFYPLFFAVYFLLLYILYLVEHGHPNANINTYSNSIWYSIVTLTTVGYGDYFPVTFWGRVVGVVFVFGSLGTLGFLVSQLSVKIQKYMEDKKYGALGTDMEGHTVVFGYNQFAARVVDEVLKAGKQVAVVTNSRAEIDAMNEKYKTHSLFKLFSEYDNYVALEKANIDAAKSVFVCFENDSDSLVHVLNLKARFGSLNIIVSLNNPMLKDTFKSVGVLFAIAQEEIASKLIASYVFEPNVATLTEDMMSSDDILGKIDMQEYLIVEGNPFLNKTYDETFVGLKKNYNAVLLGIFKAKDGLLHKNPASEMIVELNDRIILLADNENLLEKDFKVEQGA